ncbi:hypothetical protein OLK001_15570 [Synechocystis sp. LKSZ1]
MNILYGFNPRSERAIFAQFDGHKVDLATLQIEFRLIELCESFEFTAITLLSVFQDSN